MGTGCWCRFGEFGEQIVIRLIEFWRPDMIEEWNTGPFLLTLAKLQTKSPQTCGFVQGWCTVAQAFVDIQCGRLYVN